ncbi:GTP cyclohydrolase II [Jannaschia pohangensis]|uniref:GTP cyclohydrolase-2 n=1 Tax=Jannaschia pohangensis TaxID=390807 RepID=A0A1I3NX17_9RHOB|nr:GTP cyclohydrolase II [Jannaschia pohangensis]SFJ13652.1 GTP cyclohydrolase II [Jannaschia pohangensis]
MPSPANALAPTPAERLTRIRSDLRMGLPCLITRGTHRAILVAVETVSPERYAGLHALCGAPELVLASNRARAIMSAAASADLAHEPVRIRPPDGADIDWFRTLSDTAFDQQANARGPLHVLRDGDHALASFALTLVKSAELLPSAVLFAVADETVLPAELSLACLDVAEGAALVAAQPTLHPVAASAFPLQAADRGSLHVFRDPTGRYEHYALEIGDPDRSQPVLSRLHSACFTGDVLGSLKCDCGPQLQAALAQMGSEGAGVLLYLNQEGRGIGLANKMRVYDLQLQGFDTVEANHRLGFEDDERDFRVAAEMLRRLGFSAARLLTNNPKKTEVFEMQGIAITEQLPLRVGRNIHNSGYLSVKALKSGHAL